MSSYIYFCCLPEILSFVLNWCVELLVAEHNVFIVCISNMYFLRKSCLLAAAGQIS